MPTKTTSYTFTNDELDDDDQWFERERFIPIKHTCTICGKITTFGFMWKGWPACKVNCFMKLMLIMNRN